MEDQSIEGISHDLDRTLRTALMFVSQMIERRARRASEGHRDAAGRARQGFLDERDSARKTYLPATFGKRAEQMSPQALAQAWRAAHQWASTDPVAGAAAEHLNSSWERLYPDRDPRLVGVPLDVGTAQQLAQQHAPDFYSLHHQDRLITTVDGQPVPDQAAQERLVRDWEHYNVHGRLPRESLLWENAHGQAGGTDAARRAGQQAVEDWKNRELTPEPGGADGVGVRVVPLEREAEVEAVRVSAQTEFLETLWEQNGREPLPADPGESLTPGLARSLAEKHAPAYYQADRLTDEQLVADWTHWQENDQMLPLRSVRWQWAQHVGRGEDVTTAVDDAERELRDQVPEATDLQVKMVRDNAEAEQLEKIWASSSQITVEEAEQLAEKYAPAYYSAPDSAVLREDWQAFTNDGELPMERRQEAWAAWAGSAAEVSVEAWTDPDSGVDEFARREALQRVWDEGREERGALEFAHAVAGIEAEAADAAELDESRAQTMSRAAESLGENAPDAEDLIGSAEHARTVYVPLLDPAEFASSEQAHASRAWLAATVWADSDPQAKAAAEQLEGAYRARFGVDPSTGEAVQKDPDSVWLEPEPPAAEPEPGATAQPAADLGPEAQPASAAEAAVGRGLAPQGEREEPLPPPAAVDPTQPEPGQALTPAPTPNRPVPAAEPVPVDPARQRAVELNEQAAAFYAQQYPGSKAQQHLRDRFGPQVESAGGLAVGYAPPGRRLTEHLRRQGASDTELVDAGLSAVNSRGQLYDVLRDRVTLAVRDHRDSAVVGFTARDLSGRDDVPKYMNTKSTAAFDKSQLMVGLAEAPQGARLTRVEGGMDVLAINLACRGQVAGVAPMGTALTGHQADLLAARSSDGTVLSSLDNDAAGRTASEKDAALLADRGISTRAVMTMAEDPAQAWKQHPELLTAIVGLPATAHRHVGSELAEHDLREARFETPEERVHALRSAARHITQAPASDQREVARQVEGALSDRYAEATGERLSPGEARERVEVELRDGGQHARWRTWSRGSSWSTFAGDLTGDAEAATWETQQQTHRRADEQQVAEEEHRTTADGLDEQAHRAPHQQPAQQVAGTAPQGAGTASDEGRERSPREDLTQAGSEERAAADEHHGAEEDLRDRARAIHPASAPAPYDRASESTPEQPVERAEEIARRRAAAGFTRSTPEAVSASRARRARLPKKPPKTASNRLAPGREQSSELGR